jgi:hypothetical protein
MPMVRHPESIWQTDGRKSLVEKAWRSSQWLINVLAEVHSQAIRVLFKVHASPRLCDSSRPPTQFGIARRERF